MSVKEQYDTYPYPARDPKDERKRLITGSPSHPLEMDHYLFGGRRNWAKPIRILVAGGGTGDALVQMATLLSAAARPYEITYIDLSETARAIAEARIAERGVTGVSFHTDDLTNAPDYGEFDYIDCCGVLHHLPDPSQGFGALSRALAPEGGLGLMVYAPYGRSGVYPLQEAFGALSKGMTAKERLALGKATLKEVPAGHPFKRNTVLVDHRKNDAGFYDLLLHSQDRPYSVGELASALEDAGLEVAAFLPPALYDLGALLPEGVPVPEHLDPLERMGIAEKLRGTIKTHAVYAVKAGRAGAAVATGQDKAAIPHLKGVTGPQMAEVVARKGRLEMDFQDEVVKIKLAKEFAPMIAAIDGVTPLEGIQMRSGFDSFLFPAKWKTLHDALSAWNMIFYSRLLA